MIFRQYRQLKKNARIWLIKRMGSPGARHDLGWRKWVSPVYAFLSWNLIGVVAYYALSKENTTLEQRALSSMKEKPIRITIGKGVSDSPELPTVTDISEIPAKFQEMKDRTRADK